MGILDVGFLPMHSVIFSELGDVLQDILLIQS